MCDLWFDVRGDCKVILDSETFTGHVEFDTARPTLIKQGNRGDNCIRISSEFYCVLPVGREPSNSMISARISTECVL